MFQFNIITKENICFICICVAWCMKFSKQYCWIDYIAQKVIELWAEKRNICLFIIYAV